MNLEQDPRKNSKIRIRSRSVATSVSHHQPTKSCANLAQETQKAWVVQKPLFLEIKSQSKELVEINAFPYKTARFVHFHQKSDGYSYRWAQIR